MNATDETDEMPKLSQSRDFNMIFVIGEDPFLFSLQKLTILKELLAPEKALYARSSPTDIELLASTTSPSATFCEKLPMPLAQRFTRALLIPYGKGI